jgi:probable F420-dependent oxidoreductase
MRIGLHALGIGAGAQPAVIEAVAGAADRAGFATLWAGEHVVMVDRPDSRYPYSGDGEIPIDATADWLDPFVCLTFAAATTSRIRIATGVLLLPEHNPLVVAKQAASLDLLSGGRLMLGVGVGWSAEEFDALGVSFAHRGQRTLEYVDVLRTLWRDDPASFSGRFAAFSGVRIHPKPVQNAGVPIVFGGNSDPALARVATAGDGWYGFNLAGVDAVGERLAHLREQCAQARRDPAGLYLAAAVADAAPESLPALEALGLDELVVAAAPPADPGAATEWVRSLAARWSVLPTP